MKPPLFHVGQAVVCLCKRWPGSDTDAAPLENQVYIIVKLHNDFGIWWLELAEFPPSPAPSVWSEDKFAPIELASDEALAELLEEVFTPVHA